jgi:ABC-2 type transport system permease protein
LEHDLLAPGSLPWLLAHDLRLASRRFRSIFRKLTLTSTILLILTAEAVFHLMALPAAAWLGKLEVDPDPAAYRIALGAGFLLVLSFVTAQGLTGSARALNARGELDIVLASPVQARNVVIARAIAMAAEAVGSVSILVAPVIDMNILAGRLHWFCAYPVLVGAALLGTAFGLVCAIAMFTVMGPRRARLVSQVSAALIGGGFVLAAQIANLLPQAWRDTVFENLASAAHRGFESAPLAWLPVRAIAGDAGALLAWSALALAVFGLVTAVLGERFAKTAISAAGGLASSASARARRVRSFRMGAGRALRRKELLLIARDPWLMSQVFLQIVYVLPVAVILMHGESTAGSFSLAAGPSIVVIASQLSGAFAWIAISGEDAPDLLSSAPLTRGRIERGKIEAISVPVVLIVGPPLAWFAYLAPYAAATALLFVIGASVSTACLNLWHPSPGKRGDMMRRHQQSKLLGMIEHLISLFFAVGCAMALVGTSLAAIPVILALGVLWLNRKKPPKPVRGPVLAGEPAFVVSGERASSRS